jgi:FKBP-type peptidyl-prolyl cis-trans isomerase
MRRIALAVLAAVSISACTKKGGEALVLEKEHIDAADPYPSVTPSPTAPGQTMPSPSAAEEPVERELAADEIVVDTFVMKKDARGTKKDPRATTDEQWRVTVQMVAGGRQFVVQTDGARYETIKAGDRVKVRYKEGNYTGTVWGAEIVD